MSKKKDLFRKKLELLSELSVDNVVNISKNGNYFVNMERIGQPHIVTKKIEFRGITKNTINKLFTDKLITVQSKPNILMLTKTGKLLATYKIGSNIYRDIFKFNNVGLSNYWKYGPSWGSKEVRDKYYSLIFFNKKCNWLKDKSYAHCGMHLLKQYKSLNEFKKHLGYSFLTDSRFEGLFTTCEVKDNQNIYPEYNQKVLETLIVGKLTTEQCRKFLVINILECLKDEDIYRSLHQIANIITNNFEAFKQGLVIQNTYYKTINYGTSIQSTTEDEDLPF